jgi:hypothetical protein
VSIKLILDKYYPISYLYSREIPLDLLVGRYLSKLRPLIKPARRGIRTLAFRIHRINPESGDPSSGKPWDKGEQAGCFYEHGGISSG